MQRLIRFFLFILTVTMVLAACETAPNRRFENKIVQLQDEQYNLQLRYVDQEELEERSGRYPSPFISRSYLDTRELVVFELVVKNKSDVSSKFQLKNLELKVGPSIYGPKNAFTMKRFWDAYDIDTNDRARMDKQLDQYIYDREVSIPAGGLKRGWLVFFANLPKYGEMTVSLPLFSDQFQPDIYEFDFAFTNFN